MIGIKREITIKFGRVLLIEIQREKMHSNRSKQNFEKSRKYIC